MNAQGLTRRLRFRCKVWVSNPAATSEQDRAPGLKRRLLQRPARQVLYPVFGFKACPGASRTPFLVNQYRGRVDAVEEDQVHVSLWQEPSGRHSLAVLPASWFLESGNERAVPRSDLAFFLRTWIELENGRRIPKHELSVPVPEEARSLP